MVSVKAKKPKATSRTVKKLTNQTTTAKLLQVHARVRKLENSGRKTQKRKYLLKTFFSKGIEKYLENTGFVLHKSSEMGVAERAFNKTRKRLASCSKAELLKTRNLILLINQEIKSASKKVNQMAFTIKPLAENATESAEVKHAFYNLVYPMKGHLQGMNRFIEKQLKKFES